MASFFWVGGTGTWDNATTTHWASSSGGAGGVGVPGSADTVTFDGSSGGGTVTLNFGGTITIQSLTIASFTGTWDNSVNNNNITMTASGGFSGSGSGTRTVKMGSATYTVSNNAANCNWNTATNLTLQAGTSTLAFTGSSGIRQLQSGGTLTWGNITFGASSGAGYVALSGNFTCNSLSITAPNYVTFPASQTVTISTSFTWGSALNAIGIASNTIDTQATIAAAASSTAQNCAFRDMAFTGSPTATNSLDLLNNSGITITGPSIGGGGVGVIGS